MADVTTADLVKYGMGCGALAATGIFMRVLAKRKRVRCSARIEATITEVRVEQRRSTRNKHTHLETTYIGIYTYEVNGAVYHKHSSPTSNTNRYHVGDKGLVMYNPAKPKDGFIAAEGPTSGTWGAVLISIAVFLYVVVLAGYFGFFK